MTTQNTTVHALHDLGAAAWFGGSLMGAIGLNGAANAVTDRTDRTVVSSVGWAKWAPANAVAIGAHLVGGLAIAIANRDRAAHHRGVRANTIAKTGLTVAALATTTYSGVLGVTIAKAGAVSAEGAVKPDAATPVDVRKAQQQQRILQWITPALTGIIVVLGAQQSEQQRPGRRLAGAVDGLRSRVTG